jgi:hypothetical protein
MSKFTIRPLQLTDLGDVALMYQRQLREEPEVFGGYPHDPEHSPADLIQLCQQGMQSAPHDWIGYVAVQAPDTGAFGEPVGGEPIGVVIATHYWRTLGTPHDVVHVEWIYVRPEVRGHLRCAMQLLHVMADEARRRFPRDTACEGAYAPGSHAERIWKKLGMKPYVVRCALLDDAGAVQRHFKLEERFAPATVA